LEQSEARARYDAVIHLRTPTLTGGYNHQNPLRLESAAQASLADERVLAIWSVLDILRSHLPACCRHHEVPDVDDVGGRHEGRINGL
jgi:hypothetical protein